MDAMSEFETFVNSMLLKSETTQKNYKSKYLKLVLLFKSELKEVSQKKVIEVLKDHFPNINSLQANLNIVVVVRKLYNMPTNELEAFRGNNIQEIKTKIVENNKVLVETLPEYEKLLDHLEELYARGEWRAYVVNYLLIHCQVRNQDLVCDIVTKVSDAKDSNKNFLILQLKLKTIRFIRNVYKTAKIVKPDGDDAGYGQLVINLKETKLTNAVKQLVANGETQLIPNTTTLAYTIKKYTYNGLGEGEIFKIVVNHFRNDPDKLQEIGRNRGTALQTILSFYDIEKKA
jgi:hypothetical protein